MGVVIPPILLENAIPSKITLLIVSVSAISCIRGLTSDMTTTGAATFDTHIDKNTPRNMTTRVTTHGRVPTRLKTWNASLSLSWYFVNAADIVNAPKANMTADEKNFEKTISAAFFAEATEYPTWPFLSGYT